jgi:hypothetical protein
MGVRLALEGLDIGAGRCIGREIFFSALERKTYPYDGTLVGRFKV